MLDRLTVDRTGRRRAVPPSSAFFLPSVPRAGIVTVAGKPNAGKSTLLNRIVGEKLAIVSPKPQSTRDRIVGIHSTADAQIVLLDTPGLLDPRYALQRSMRATALAALRDADIILYLVDATSGEPEPLASVAGLDHPPRAPIVVAMNKLDLLGSSDRAALADRVPDAALVSAATGEGIDALVARLAVASSREPFSLPGRRAQHSDGEILCGRAGA